MILFFRTPSKSVIAVECNHELPQADSDKLCWLFGEATPESEDNLKGHFVGPRREMITPWSTNAVEITQNMGLDGIIRIEEYFPVKDENADHDPMLQRMYKGLDQNVFTTNRQPEPIVHIEDLEAYNEKEGLALSKEEMDYLKKVEKDLGRPLTDSEVFGFAQINSEHCRHKIFGGTFIIDGVEQESSLFQMIKKTTQENPNKIISAYKDNVAFAEGPVIARWGFRHSVLEVTRRPVCHVLLQRCAGADMLDDAAAQAQLDEAAQLLTEAGFVQYLPRRWAKPGCEDKFWQGAANGMDVLAFGLSAYTRLDGMITTNTSDLNTYLAHSADYEQITVSTVPVQTAE